MSAFQGIPREGVRFLEQLRANNDKVWFDKHKTEYQQHLLEPSRDFVVAMGERLRDLAPAIVADPRVNGSLFKIHRDTRFSKDKSPFKTNVGIYFWEGAGKRMECPGFYLHLGPPTVMIGGGMHTFPRELLEPYREAAADPKLGPQLREAVDQVGDALGGDPFEIAACYGAPESYKRVPKGYDPDHPNADLLRRKGLSAGIESPIPDELHGPELVDYAYERFEAIAPLHRWLVAMIGKYG